MGWPKGKPRGPRAAQAQPQAQTAIDEGAYAPAPAAASPAPQRARAAQRPAAEPAAPPRAAIGHNSGRAVALGRDGQELSRRRTISSDQFYIDPKWIPHGWDWQWNVHDVLGQPQIGTKLGMLENGWRAVTADRVPGVFMPEGYKGPILRDGLALEERPMILTEEARREEAAKAGKQVRDQQEQLMLSKKGALGDGFSDDAQYRGVGAHARTTIAPANDIPRPRLEIDPAQ